MEISLVKNAQAPRHKPHEVEEATGTLTITRKCFRHLALDYVLQINVLQAKKKFEILDAVRALSGCRRGALGAPQGANPAFLGGFLGCCFAFVPTAKWEEGEGDEFGKVKEKELNPFFSGGEKGLRAFHSSCPQQSGRKEKREKLLWEVKKKGLDPFFSGGKKGLRAFPSGPDAAVISLPRCCPSCTPSSPSSSRATASCMSWTPT
uniref:Arf-GAP with coiled-coil, ANK repeat and PH domain-containing protein n=1 Tax=Cyanistes caeruleus TaxID=156563 RepID=A0A8C0ZE74_CYACU